MVRGELQDTKGLPEAIAGVKIQAPSARKTGFWDAGLQKSSPADPARRGSADKSTYMIGEDGAGDSERGRRAGLDKEGGIETKWW